MAEGRRGIQERVRSGAGAVGAAAGGVARRVPWLSKLGLPLGVSLALHGVIAGALIASAWGVHESLSGGKARSELVINLPTPVESPTEESKPNTGPIVAPPMTGAAVAPRLQGLTSPTAAPAPVLRSAGAEMPGPGEFLRREDDAAVGGATFAGMGARRATSVVYVVDASGAMVSSLKFVLAELERSVRGLSSSQKFQVILFHERAGAAGYESFVPPGAREARLAPATPTNKAALSQWLATITPSGRSNPLEGLREGLELQPDAIFLLSRSIRRSGGELDAGAGSVWGRGTEQILAELEPLNPRRGDGSRRVVIKCIQFLEEDPTGTMQAIGTGHGDGPGSYSVLTLKALGGQ